MRRAVALGIVVLLSFAARRASADTTGFDFGFTDAKGEQLIVVGAPGKPEYARAICHGGVEIAVRRVAHQAGAEKQPARHTAAYFSQLEGDVYRLPTPVEPNQTCVLRAGVESSAVRVTTGKLAECAATTSRQLSERARRKVARCWRLAGLDGGDGDGDGEIVTAVMRKQGKQALAVVAVRDGKRLAVREYRALCDGKEPSCWRVDDGNEWDAASFAVLGAFRAPRGLIVAVTWGGAEGETAMLLPAYDDAAMKAPLQETYRYWSPE